MHGGCRRFAAGAVVLLLSTFALVAPAEATGPVVGTGTVSCAISAHFSFDPPLSSPGTATTETITVAANLKGCSGTGDGTRITKGKVGGTATAAGNDCSVLAGTHATNLTTTTVWKTTKNTPTLANTSAAFASTTGVADGNGKVRLSATGTVTSGSFSGDSASVSALLSKSLNSIGNACLKGKLKAVGTVASGSSVSLT